MGETAHFDAEVARGQWRLAGMGACLLLAAVAGSPVSGHAASIKQDTAVDCQLADGRGFVRFSSNKYLGEVAGTQKFSQWVFEKDGVKLGDRIGVFWTPAANAEDKLRVAIDGPVPKSARLVSVSASKVVGLAASSSSNTTRIWLITVDFKEETVMAMASSSGAMAVKGQLMTLDCRFKSQTD